MTTTQALQTIHRLYQGDVDYPSTSDDDYTLRLGLIGDAIRVWEMEGDGRWPELYTNLSAAADGDKTTTASTSAYDAPTNFKIMHGYVRVDDANGSQTFYPEAQLDEVQLLANDTVTKRFYISGNTQDGYKVNILPAPDTSSLDITYEYFKTADIPTTGSDVIEMADPMYIVYYVLSILFENDGEGDRAVKALDQANDRLAKMRLRRMVVGAYQDNSVPDRDFDLGGGAFGM